MNIKEAQEIVAKKHHYPDWDTMYNWISREGEKPEVVAQLIRMITIEAYELINPSTVVYPEYLYRRSMEYCKAQYGDEPNRLEIMQDGTLRAVYRSRYGDEDYQEFNANELSSDLDALYAERKRREEEERIRQEKRRQEIEANAEIDRKRKRREEYERLKKNLKDETHPSQNNQVARITTDKRTN